MWPLIKNGEIVHITKVSDIQKGDIITVQNHNNIILTHRVMDKIRIITKGDNNTFPEKSLLHKPFVLMGKVTKVIRTDGKELNINEYRKIFFWYSYIEMMVFKYLKMIINSFNFLNFLKQVCYFIFLLIFKTASWSWKKL